MKVGGRVFATVNHTPGYGTDLYALDATTGSTLWGPISLGGLYWFVGLTADSQAVYTINYDGWLTAFDQVTGRVRWTTLLPARYDFTSPPTVTGGTLYVGGRALYAVDPRNGAIRWSASVVSGDQSSPAVADGGVYVAYACDFSYRFDAVTGAEVWSTNFGCSGGGGKTPVLHGDSVIVRENLGDVRLKRRLSQATGKELGTVDTVLPPAFDGDLGFFVALTGPSDTFTLSAVDQTTGAKVWSSTGDGSFITAPVTIDGKVILGSSTGRVTALDERTGVELWSGAAGAPILYPNEHNAVQTAALAVADGLLLVPATNRLVAFG